MFFSKHRELIAAKYERSAYGVGIIRLCNPLRIDVQKKKRSKDFVVELDICGDAETGVILIATLGLA